MRIPPPCRGLRAAVVAAFVVLAAGPSARAGLMTFNASPATGDPAGATVTFDDTVSPGSVRVTVTVNPNPNVGDINGFFFNFGLESLLPGLQVLGSDVTFVVKSANNVTSAGGGNNVNGGGITPFDVGVRIGSAGIGENDIQSTSFLLSHDTQSLTNDLFTSSTTESGDIFAVRMTSVGPADGPRNGSSKLTDDGLVDDDPPPLVESPEPSTLLGLGTLGALGMLVRRVRGGRAAQAG